MSKALQKGTTSVKKQYLKYSVGIDISKDKFDGNISVIDDTQHVKIIASRKFTNTVSGFEDFYKWVSSRTKLDLTVVYVMESTGVYYESLAWFLHRKEQYISVVLPNRAKDYIKSLGFKSKTDKIDAKGLARMGAEKKLDKWKAPDEKTMKLRSITRQRRNLQEFKTMLNNQLHALKSAEISEDLPKEQLQELITTVMQQIKETEHHIKQLVEKDEELNRKMSNITKIKGLGIIAVSTVLAETNMFKMFESQAQLVSYAGYDVVENSSGKHSGPTKISKKGNAHIRRILHLPAFSVVKNNEPVFKNLYERVYDRTKIKMKAYVAVQRKLLTIIYALWKTETEYIPDFESKKTFGDKEQKPSLLTCEAEKKAGSFAACTR